MQFHNNTQIFEIEDSKMRILESFKEGSTKYLRIMRDRENHICPKCGRVTNRVHDYRVY